MKQIYQRSVRYKISDLLIEKSIRDEKRLSFEDVALATGISRKKIVRIAKNIDAPSANMIVKLCKYFEVGTSQLMEDLLD